MSHINAFNRILKADPIIMNISDSMWKWKWKKKTVNSKAMNPKSYWIYIKMNGHGESKRNEDATTTWCIVFVVRLQHHSIANRYISLHFYSQFHLKRVFLPTSNVYASGYAVAFVDHSGTHTQPKIMAIKSSYVCDMFAVATFNQILNILSQILIVYPIL